MNPSNDISVVIPVFNGANFIIGTLSSVVAQTILPLEIIIVDDGSEDETCNIIEDFSRSYPKIKIRLLRELHRGPGAARNTGIRAANGPWIAFLDSDDLWHPNKLEKISKSQHTMNDVNIICNNEIHRQVKKVDTVIDYSLGFNDDIP